MHASSGNIKFKPYSDANNVIDKLLKSLRSKFQVNLITSMRGSDFIFDSVQLMYYKCHRVKFIAGGLHIVSSYRIFCILKKKKYIQLQSQKLIQIVKANNLINDYLAVKKLSTVFIGITSKHHCDFCCLSFLHSFRTENKLMKRYVRIRIFVEL